MQTLKTQLQRSRGGLLGMLALMFIVLALRNTAHAQTSNYKIYERTNRGVAQFSGSASPGCDGLWYLDPSANTSTYSAPSGGELCVKMEANTEQSNAIFDRVQIDFWNYLAVTVYDTLSTTAWKYLIDLEVERSNTSGGASVTQTFTAEISYDPTERKTHTDRIVYELPGKYQQAELLSVTINDSNHNPISSFEKNWMVELIMKESVYDTTAIPALNPSIGFSGLGLDLQLEWDDSNKVPQPSWYQLEWVFVDSLTTLTQPLAEYFRQGATRISRDSNFYTVTNHFALAGTFYYRVRAARAAWDGSANDINHEVDVFGMWHYDSLPISDAQTVLSDSLNWSYNAMYTENGHKLENLAYFDGRGTQRQSLMKPGDYDSLVIASQVMTDHAGNPALSVQAAPVRGTDLRFQPGLNQWSGAGANGWSVSMNPKMAFDSVGVFPMEMDTTSGSNQYHSGGLDIPANYPLQGLTPRGEGYAYSYMEYDASGRIRYESIPGRTFRLDTDSLAPNHFTRHVYSKPRKSDIYPFLGSHAGSFDDYTVEDVTDPNGQTSIRITDTKGRVVITALTTQPENLIEIDSKPEPIYTIEDLLYQSTYNKPVPNAANPTGYSFEYPISIRNNSSVMLNYSAIGNYLEVCADTQSLCYQCKYEAEVTLVRYTGDTLLHWQKGDLSLDSAGLAGMKNCFADSLLLYDPQSGINLAEFSTLPVGYATTTNYGGGLEFTLNKGLYFIRKELRLMDQAGLDILADDYVLHGTATECLLDEYYFIDSTTTARDYACPVIYSEYSLKDGPCEDLKQEMMADLYPTLGKFAAFESGIQAMDTFSIFKAILNQPIYGANMLLNGDFEAGDTAFASEFPNCQGSFGNTEPKMQKIVASDPSQCLTSLDNNLNLGENKVLAVMRSATDFARIHHKDTLGFLAMNPDTFDLFMIYGQRLVLDSGQTYNFQGDFWDMNDPSSGNGFLPSAVRVFIDSVQIGVVHINAANQSSPFHANFNFTPNISIASDTFHLMVMADLGCCSYNTPDTTRLNYALDNLQFTTVDFSCGCEGLGLSNPSGMTPIYPYQCLDSAFNAAGITASYEGSTMNPALLPVGAFITEFDTSWLETMLPVHPEYCNLGACEIIYSDSSVAFLQKIERLDWTAAKAEFNGFSFDTTGANPVGLFAYDPLFNAISNPNHALHFLYLDMLDRLGQYFWFGTGHLNIEQASVLFSWPAANMLLDTALLTAAGDTNVLNEWLGFAMDSSYDHTYLGPTVWEKYTTAYQQIRNFLSNNYYRTCLDCGFDTLIQHSMEFVAQQRLEDVKGKSFLLFGDSNLMFDDTLNYQAYYNFIDSMEVLNETALYGQCYDWVIFQLHQEFNLVLDTANNDSTWFIAGTSISDSALADTLQYYCAGDSSALDVQLVLDAMGIPQTLQQNAWVLEIGQVYQELYAMMNQFNMDWEGCYDLTPTGTSFKTTVELSSALIQSPDVHWYNPTATGYGIPAWVSNGTSLNFFDFRCDSAMIEHSAGTIGQFTSLHCFTVKVENGTDTIALRGFYNDDALFEAQPNTGPVQLTMPNTEDRIYCSDLYPVALDFFHETIIQDYLTTPIYFPPGGGTSDTLELAWHPAFAPTLQAYVSEHFDVVFSEFQVIEFLASCAIPDSLMDTIPELAFHFADTVFYDTRPVCPPNAQIACDSCDWFYDELIAYEFANTASSAMNIQPIRSHFASLGIDTTEWVLEYPHDVDEDNYNDLFAYRKSDYYPGLFSFLDSTLSEWQHADSTIPPGGSLQLSGHFEGYPGLFPNASWDFGSFSGSMASIDSLSEGTYSPAKCWIRHSGNGRLWFHFAIAEADTFHDVFLDYDHHNGAFELDDLQKLLFIQPMPRQGNVFEFYAGFMDGDSNLQVLMGSSSFPVASMCELPAVSLTKRPSNQPRTWQADCMELEYYDAFEEGELLYQQYIESKRKQFKDEYLATCKESLIEKMPYGSDLGTYHYTLYFYDRADNLWQTVPPNGVDVPTIAGVNGGLLIDTNMIGNATDYLAGTGSFVNVNHTMPSRYEYNSYEEVVASESPDGGRMRTHYDKLGRVMFSQNAEQRTGERYAYTLHDDLSRPVESGEFTGEAKITMVSIGGGLAAYHLVLHYGPGNIFMDTLVSGVNTNYVYGIFDTNQINATNLLHFDAMSFVANHVSYATWKAFIEAKTRSHAVVTQYTTDQHYSWKNYGTTEARNLQNRVSAMYKYETLASGGTANYDNAMLFDYDVAGNVKTLYREAKDMDFKISKRFDYYYDQVSGKVHEMRYQAGEEDALWHRYSYDAQNRLKRVETSRNGVIWDVDAEYAYYAHGPLARVVIGQRAIQSVEYAYTLQGWLKAINGVNSIEEAGSPSGVEDAFAMNLHYHGDDFHPVSGPQYTEPNSINAVDLYNGNIAAWSQNMVQPHTSTPGEADNYLATGKKYRYDQLNRIKEYWDFDMNSSQSGVEGWGNINGIYANFKFDGNGNITHLVRSGEQKDGNTAVMDSLDYQYTVNTNQLQSVCEVIEAQEFCCDFDEINIAHRIWRPLGYNLPDSVAEPVLVPGSYCTEIASNYPFDLNATESCGTYHKLGELILDSLAYDQDSVCKLDTINGKFSTPSGIVIITLVWAYIDHDTEFEYDAIGNLIADHEGGLEVEWNPIGKVKRVNKSRIQAYQENEVGIWPGTVVDVDCPDCDVVLTGTTGGGSGGGGGETPVYTKGHLQKRSIGTIDFDYDPTGERTKKHSRLSESAIAYNNILTNSDDTTLAYADIVGTCINNPDRYSWYMRDAQGNLIATYNLALELKQKKKFYRGMLRNLRSLHDVGPVATWDSIIQPILEGDGRLTSKLMTVTGHDMGDVLDSIDHNDVFNNDPSILIQLNTEYMNLHSLGFWNRYPTQMADIVSSTAAYDAYATALAADIADSIHAAEILLYQAHEETLEDDINLEWNRFMVCYNRWCSGDEPCFDCEAFRSDTAAYDSCLATNGCAPPYCTAKCLTKWENYDELASLLSLWDRHAETEDSAYNSLADGSGVYAESNYFTADDVPLAHTQSAMASTAVTGSAIYRAYLDIHYGVIDWKTEVLPIVDANRLLDDFLPQFTEDWFGEALDTFSVTDSLEGMVELLADSVLAASSRYRAEDFLADMDQAYGAGTWTLCLFDSTDTAGVMGALAAYKSIHTGKFDAVSDMGDLAQVFDNRPKQFLGFTLKPEEYYVYGSNRLGSIYHYTAQETVSGVKRNTNEAGNRRYELSDHLGNVKVVVSDRLAAADTAGSSAPDAFKADVWSVMDYYPYGMLMPERSANMQEMVKERAYFLDTIEVVSWTDKTIDQPHPGTGGFMQPLDGTNQKWEGKAWINTTNQTGNPDFSESTTTASPLVYQYSGSQIEMQLAGTGYKSMRLEYNINSTTVPLMDQGDSFTVELVPIFDGSFTQTWVEIRDEVTGDLIKAVGLSPYNNIGVPVTIGFSVDSLTDIDVIIRCDFLDKDNYAPDLVKGGHANWTNAIYLEDWNLTLHKRKVTKEQVSDTSDFFYRPRYAFGFNGMYRDDELRGQTNSYATLFRMLDVRLGRWWSADPVFHPEMSAYNSFDNNPIYWIDPRGSNADGYKDKDGNLMWAHDQKGESFERDGVKYEKVTDDFFKFSDMAAKEGKEIHFSGKLDLALADRDDMVAAMNNVNKVQRENIRAGWGKSLTSADLFNFSNVPNSEWKLIGGNVGGNVLIREFKTENGTVHIKIIPMSPTKVRLSNIPKKFSPVTNRDVKKGPDGKYSFPQHPSVKLPYGIRLEGMDDRVSGGGETQLNVVIIQFDSAIDFAEHWKRASRSWNTKK